MATRLQAVELRQRALARLRSGIPVWGEAIDGASLLNAVLAGLGRIRAMRERVNALNVFPVPDGDTGTNMVLTLQAACDKAREDEHGSAADVAAALAQGALMGARGNSGVILSQLWRGFSLGLEGCKDIRADDFARALEKARETAYRGVIRPVEGTILTVATDAAAEAREAVGEGIQSVVDLLERVVRAAEESVRRTPDLLPMLRQAGVVDSGGAALFYMLEGMLRSAYGEKLEDEEPGASLPTRPSPVLHGQVEAGQDWEVVVDVALRGGSSTRDLQALLEPIGTSLQIGEGEGVCRVHLHLAEGRQYQAIEAARGVGVVLRAALENLRAQVEGTTGPASGKAPGLGSVRPGQIAVVAVASGGGFAKAGGEERDRPHPVFVGRERELGRLAGFLERCCSGEGLTVIVTGEPGIGKTALLRRFALEAQALHPDLIVASGSGNALTGAGDPYLPFRDVLAMLTGDVEQKWIGGAITGEEARRLWSILPLAVEALHTHGPDLVGSFLPAPALVARACSHAEATPAWLAPLQRMVERSALRPIDAAIRQKDLHEQYTRVLQILSKAHPIVLILDDLQWADEDSLGLLFHLSRRTRDHRILVLGATRSPGAEAEGHPERRWLAEILLELRRAQGDVQLDLGTDGEGEAQRFVEAFLDSEPNGLDETFRHELLRHTGGHPLFTVELLRAMEGRGDIVRDDHGRWVRGRGLSWEDLPARVEGVIDERLEALDEGQLDILRLASVEGEEFTAEVISRVWNSDARDVVGQLSEALDRQQRLVSALGSRLLGATRLSVYRFRHILFQKHLYSRLDSVQRAYMHQDVGNALEAIYGEHANEFAVQLAHQFSRAGLARKALAYLQEAAERAKRISAHTEAVAHLRNALQLAQSLPEEPERRKIELGLQTSLGVSLIAVRGYASPEVEGAFRRAHELCQGLEGSPPLFPVLYGLRAFYLARACYAAAHELGRQLLAIAEGAQDRELLVEAHQAFGTTLFYMGEFKPAREHLETCLSLYDVQHDFGHAIRYGQDPAVACYSYLSLTHWAQGESRRAREACARAISHAERIAHPFSMTLALIFAALLARERGQDGIAREHAQAAEALSAENGFAFWHAAARILVGVLRVQAGERDGVAQILEGLASWQETGSQLGRSYYAGLLASALLQLGELDQGLQIVDEALGSAGATGERLNLAELHRIRAVALDGLGRTAEADHSLGRAIEVAHTQGAAAYQLRAALDLMRMRRGEDNAERALREAYSLLPDPGEGPESEEARRALGLEG